MVHHEPNSSGTTVLIPGGQRGVVESFEPHLRPDRSITGGVSPALRLEASYISVLISIIQLEW